MISAVIFDMDGLMIDSEGLHHEALNRTLSPFGVHIGPEENLRYIGVPDPDSFADVVERYRLVANPEQLTQRKREIFKRLIEEQVTARPGLLDLIARLERSRYRLAVASSAALYEIEFVMERLKLAHHFAALCSVDEVERGKPSPDVFLLAAWRLGVEPVSCLVLEDAPSGVRAAKAAGMTCFAIPNNQTRSGDFSPANRVLASLSEVWEALRAVGEPPPR